MGQQLAQLRLAERQQILARRLAQPLQQVSSAATVV
jgi:hypothetical protein